jgi:hypothetical protein
MSTNTISKTGISANSHLDSGIFIVWLEIVMLDSKLCELCGNLLKNLLSYSVVQLFFMQSLRLIFQLFS